MRAGNKKFGHSVTTQNGCCFFLKSKLRGGRYPTAMFFVHFFINRYPSFGTVISNRAPFPGRGNLSNADSGDRKDFTGKKQTKPGLLSKTAFKQMVLVFSADSHTIILNCDHESRIPLFRSKGDRLKTAPPYLSALSIRL